MVYEVLSGVDDFQHLVHPLTIYLKSYQESYLKLGVQISFLLFKCLLV